MVVRQLYSVQPDVYGFQELWREGSPATDLATAGMTDSGPFPIAVLPAADRVSHHARSGARRAPRAS